jgi:hypothetical protein
MRDSVFVLKRGEWVCHTPQLERYSFEYGYLGSPIVVILVGLNDPINPSFERFRVIHFKVGGDTLAVIIMVAAAVLSEVPAETVAAIELATVVRIHPKRYWTHIILCGQYRGKESLPFTRFQAHWF